MDDERDLRNSIQSCSHIQALEEGGTMGMAQPPGDQKLGGLERNASDVLTGPAGTANGPEMLLSMRALGTNGAAETLS
jgi:hypothetical protein